jgi:hypothetical protein
MCYRVILTYWSILCLVDRVPLIIWIITNLMYCLSSVYWVIIPLHVSGVSAAHHQEVEFIYVANGTCYTSDFTAIGPGQVHWQPTQKYNKYHLPHVHSTSWWWAADMPETCRGVTTQQTEDKQCIELVIIHIILLKYFLLQYVIRERKKSLFLFVNILKVYVFHFRLLSQ